MASVEQTPVPRANVPGKLLSDAATAGILAAVAELTMVPEAGIRFAIEQAVRVITQHVPGAIVECGVWRGGCSIAMLLAQRALLGRVERPVYLCDSFEGLPEATEADGPLARTWQQDRDSGQYFENCRATVDEVRSALEGMGFQDGEYHIVRGWFDRTLPNLRVDLEQSKIALLRLDADWYESTKVCLDELMPAVSDSAVVIVDDYYAWDGCTRAVHEYLGQHNLVYRIRSLPEFVGAYFVKKAHRDGLSAIDDGVRVLDALFCSVGNREYYLELEASNAWLEEQRAGWQQSSRELQSINEQLRAYIGQQEEGKRWLEEQRSNLAQLTSQLQHTVTEQQARITALEDTVVREQD